MQHHKKIILFIEELLEAIKEKKLQRVIFSKKRNQHNELKNVYANLIETKLGLRFNIVYRFPTNDLTKNFSLNEAKEKVIELLQNEFFNVELITTTKHFYVEIKNDNDVKLRSITLEKKEVEMKNLTHDKEKKFVVDTNAEFLKLLGVCTSEGKIKTDKQDKFKQINKFIEVINGLLNKKALCKNDTIFDMGSGKGYLTFALSHHLNNNIKIKGIEFRKDLVEKCNTISAALNFTNLSFEEGKIEELNIKNAGMLIALHACDTATDDAIAKGIKANAKIIVCSPCCHKQIRKNMQPNALINEITKHGILKERLAEMLTDTIRSLYLEAYGYESSIFDFIGTAHTPKNCMITAIKKYENVKPDEIILEKIKAIKKEFGIDFHYLDKLLF
ncbi:MAG: SAM-dependent methyltransferase [Chitinophagaceae bacterium]|nr:SAM-dependent methyltransferase [Chitinophagaceae bacterium]